MNHIGTENETSLHAQIKKWYAQSGDEIEARIDNYIVDIVRQNTLIEIQTINFAAIRHKLQNLLDQHQLRLVYPLTQEKWLIYVDKNNKILRRRKSTTKGKITDIFGELVRIPHLIPHPNFTLEVLITQEEEVRRDDGKGSWRRKGVSIVDRKLIDVLDQKVFRNEQDLLSLLPKELPDQFTNQDLGQLLNIPVYQAQKVSYCLRKMETIETMGKNGRFYLYKLC